MGLSIFSTAYLEVEDPYTVTLYKESTPNTGHDVTYVLRRNITEEDLRDIDDALIPLISVVFHLWTEPLDLALAGLRPERNDIIECLDIFYKILWRRVDSRGYRLRCFCQEMIDYNNP